MAIERNVTAADKFFLGEDKLVPVTIYQSDGVTPEDITGWNIVFLLKRKATDEDADALITKGIGNGLVITNGPQGELEISFDDSDTDGNSDLSALIKPNADYPYSIKRLTGGSETILTWGTWIFILATQRKA